ncbi:MAG: serine hydrolase domain-containing protein [Pirellulales bacterium]|jgi:CubicO group peptidase (beta-lactamase class C family)
MRYRIFTRLLFTLLAIGFSSSASAAEIASASPESVGMSATKLAEVNPVMDKFVADKRLAGGIVLVAKDGKIVHRSTHGQMDIEANKPMTEDAIMRFYSMSKAITTTAAMILYDQGKLDLDAPVSKYLPEMKQAKVYSEEGNKLPEREITVRDLMRHTSGLNYGGSGKPAVDQPYKKADVMDRDSDLAAMTTKLSQLPLVYEPGQDWMYSVSVDVLGRVVEVISEQPLDQYFQERIFMPLDMQDTGFYVPEDKINRFAANYKSNSKGQLTLKDAPGESRYLKNPKLFSGGGGLVSTARDYMRFLMMISGEGQLQGTRVLSKKSVKMMTRDQLPKGVPCIKFGEQVRTGVGFGLGFSVRTEMSDWDPQGRVGEYGWGGAASTHYWASPKDDLIVIVLEQTMPYSFMTESALKGIIYDAIKD